jgi:sterol desaturase/sphingolipid hydroxylase (fatty acid hydroxylase superfamily)
MRDAGAVHDVVKPRRRWGLALGTLALLLVGLSVRSGIVFGLVLLGVIFIPMEKLFALHPQSTFRERWRTDVVHLVVNNVLTTVGLVVAVVAVLVGVHWAVNDSVWSAVRAQPGWLQLVEAVFVADVAGYFGHRATHEVPLLWRFHKVHHSIEQMDWLAAGRLHPIDQVFTRTCVVVPLYLLGFSKATFGAYLVFATLHAIFLHANVRARLGPLRWVIAGPEFHHWHHANEPDAVNTNFSGALPLLDVLFGTAHQPRGRMPSAYGIDDELPEGYLAQLAWPFTARTPRAAAATPR